MVDLIEEVIACWVKEQVPDRPLVLAYSGGRDSHVLLHALNQRAKHNKFNFGAIHVNHGLMPQASQWAEHCAQTCQSYHVPLKVISLALAIPKGESIENIARVARYNAFKQHLPNNAILVTAHTLEDQAETFLLQLLRGAGPQGLSGIAPWKTAKQTVTVARPLLGVSREEIAKYAKHYQLNWVEDSSNDNLQFRRNFLRHQILPVLQTRYPAASLAIARSAKHCANQQVLLNQYLEADLQACLGEEKNQLNIAGWKHYDYLKQQHLLRFWLAQNNVILPSEKKLHDLLKQILFAGMDRQLCVSWGKTQIRRYKNKLYLLESSPRHNWEELRWDITQSLKIQNKTWRARLCLGRGIAHSKIENCSLQVRSRRGGERCKIAGSLVTRPLKKILQDLSIPSWDRINLPLFYQDQNLLAVGDLFVCEEWKTAPEEYGWVIEATITEQTSQKCKSTR